MKEALFIGNRVNVLKVLLDQENIDVRTIFVVKGSVAEDFLKDRKIKYDSFTLENKEKVIDIVKNMNQDILVSNGCPIKLPIHDVNNFQKKIFINIHPSKLPELKGINPINGTFLFGIDHLAATAHFMDDKIDNGNIIYQEIVKLTKDIDLGLAYFIAFELEGIVFKKALDILQDSDYSYRGVPQDGNGSYYTRKGEDCILNFDFMDTDSLINRINAFNIITMGAQYTIGEKNFKLYDPEKIINPFLLKYFEEKKPGDILKEYEGKLLIKTIDGILKINKFININSI